MNAVKPVSNRNTFNGMMEMIGADKETVLVLRGFVFEIIVEVSEFS
jgi:hypothetical protein